MANQEHLARLQQGVEAWNQWRADHPEIEPDLTDVHWHEIEFDLTGVNLSGADLRRSDFWLEMEGANLQHVNLSGEELDYAYLVRTNFRGANLSRVCFDSAFFVEVDLQGANLQGAILVQAGLTGANLSGADLREVYADWPCLAAGYLGQANCLRAELSGRSLKHANVRGANLEQAQVAGANFRWADLRGIPWTIITTLTTQAGANFEGVLWDQPEEKTH